MNARSDENGFTLIETLIAVFAIALLMSGGGTLLLSTIESGQVVQTKLERLNQLELMTAHLRSDVHNAVPRLARTGRVGEAARSFYGGRPDRDDVILGMVRTGWVNIENEADRSELLAVEYILDDEQLIRRIYTYPDRTRQTVMHDTVLADNVMDIDLTFRAGGFDSDLWELALVEGRPVMPETVSLEINFETEQTLTLRFFVGGRA